MSVIKVEIMSYTNPPEKERKQGTREESAHHRSSGQPGRAAGYDKIVICLPVNAFERSEIFLRMSQESRSISNGMKWSENGFVPSFKATDKVLIEAARRTFA
jgi:hypothetical protein